MKTRTNELIRWSLVAVLLWLLAWPAQAFYHPGTGQWLSRDPIGEKGGLNPYAFVQNNPIVLVDLWGLECVTYACLRAREVAPIDPRFTDPATGNTLYGAGGVFGEVASEGMKYGLTELAGAGAGAAAPGLLSRLGPLLKKCMVWKRAAKALTQAESSALSKINNILTKNFKTGPKGDISGAIHDMVGNPIPKPGGGVYDHVQDLGNMLRGLRNNAEALKNATDPAAVAARQQAQQVIQQIEEALKGAGL